MSASLLFATTFPALVLLLVAVAAVEVVVSRRRRRTGRDDGARTPVAAAGFDAFTGVVAPGAQDALAHRATQRRERKDQAEGAPPWGDVDLDAGVARLRRPPAADADAR